MNNIYIYIYTHMYSAREVIEFRDPFFRAKSRARPTDRVQSDVSLLFIIYLNMYTYIYIYIYREREGEREIVYIYIYIYM